MSDVFSVTELDANTRNNFTKMTLDFYNTFFPGITVHPDGFVKVDELKTMYDGIVTSNADKTDENWAILEVSLPTRSRFLDTLLTP